MLFLTYIFQNTRETTIDKALRILIIIRMLLLFELLLDDGTIE